MTTRGKVAILRSLQNRGDRVAFIPFVSAGDPNEEYSYQLIVELAQFSDVIEIGIPYSDPLADGPVIQAGSLRALKGGMSFPKALALIARVRAVTDVPIIVFTYVNPVLQFGIEELMKACNEVGADGLIIPDLPYEESAEVRGIADQYGLAFIPLLALTSHDRIKKIASSATGFAYCVSSLGVTGERSAFSDELEQFVLAVKEESPVPVAVGFGVSRPEHIRTLSAYADAVIVGSALVRRCADIDQALLQHDSELAKQIFNDLIAFARTLSLAGTHAV
ncbi:MAG: tryptophan synthase subunit alpha [Acidibacillus sp.]|uniref:Tryptophan synthase alpha chain n=1 Tax=Sulfoacidibacillus ferrooxidans TaxID=2005001 RepID=A0A9X1VAV1_9BACL|nr:tryptophan synthase subunit alpha [Sulfoacidibacillus ferrooxidans]MCI0184292.1 Tryptophan synthase alpha chain [Sulfoacidibacillus ferrooxidans]MCY0894550.1 tryptophan synthase subunit alpha [Acidibacillus sp.]